MKESRAFKGARKEAVWAKIEKFVSPKPKFFITMTAINKVGINPQFSYGNPVGIYCYQLSPDIFEQLKTNTLPFVGDKPYINVITSSGKLLYIEGYSMPSYENDIEVLRNEFKGSKDEWLGLLDQTTDINLNRNTRSPFGRLWFLTNLLADRQTKDGGKRVAAWRKILMMLGYSGIVDPGLGIIHPSEPEQSLLMDVSEIKVVTTFLNPYASDKATDLADDPDKKTILAKASKNKKGNVTVSPSGAVTIYDTTGAVEEIRYVERNDDGEYSADNDIRSMPGPSRILYGTGDQWAHKEEIWERGPGTTLKRITESNGGKKFIYKSPDLDIEFRTQKYTLIDVRKGNELFEYNPDSADDLNSGFLFYSPNAQNPGLNFELKREGGKWVPATAEDAEGLEYGGYNPKPPRLPDIEFFVTRTKFPMGTSLAK